MAELPGVQLAARAAFAAADPQEAFEVWTAALDAAIGRLPNRARTALDRVPTTGLAVTALAEATWDLVVSGIAGLGRLTSPADVRHMAYNLAAHRLAPEHRSSRMSAASQALVAAAITPASDAPFEQALHDADERVTTQLAVALRGLEEVAALAAEAGTAGELASTEPPLCEVTVRRLHSGLPGLELAGTDLFDPAAWNVGITKRGRYSRQDGVTARFHDHILHLFRGDASQYDVVDAAVFGAYGFRLIDVFVVLDEAARARGASATQPVVIDVASLADALAADGQPDRRRAAIAALTWPSSNARWRPWSMVEDPRRLSVRPFLPVKGPYGAAVLVAPTVARAANDVWNDRIAEGIWPLRGYDKGDEDGVRRSWKTLSQTIDRFFEHQVANELVQMGIAVGDVDVNVTTTAGLSRRSGVLLPCGEIDVLAIDRQTRQVVVLETKHPDLKLRPRDIAAMLRNTFVGRAGQASDIQRAARKVEFVRQSLDEVLSARGVVDPTRWEVRGAVVTPYGSPLKAYPGVSPLPVVFVEELATFLGR